MTTAEAVLRILRDAPAPLANEDLRAATGLDAQGMRDALAPLIESGAVARTGERRGTKYFLAGRPPRR